MIKLLISTAIALALHSFALAKGPTGFGGIKIGMAKDQVEALSSSDSIYLNGPMSPYKYSEDFKQIPGQDKFDAYFMTPFSSNPFKGVLTFENGKLISLYVNFEESESVFDAILKQISERYGPPRVDDTRKEEQCIYKNGANFKVTSGKVDNVWSEVATNNLRVDTSLADINLQFCPSNLRYGSTTAIKFRSLSIQKFNPSLEPKPKNVF